MEDKIKTPSLRLIFMHLAVCMFSQKSCKTVSKGLALHSSLASYAMTAGQCAMQKTQRDKVHSLVHLRKPIETIRCTYKRWNDEKQFIDVRRQAAFS